MNLKQIKSIIAVADTLSFTEASFQLSYTQSAISKHVSQVEEELSIPLFQRKASSTVCLTKEGEILIPELRKIESAYGSFSRVLDSVKEPKSNKLIIASSNNLSGQIVNKLITRFQTHYPDIEIEQIPADLNPLTLLTSNTADILITIEATKTSIMNNLSGFDEIGSLILDYPPLQILLPSNHPAIHNGKVSLIDLKEETFIIHGPHYETSTNNGPMFTSFCEVCKEAGFTPNFIIRKMRTSTISELISKGVGISPILYEPSILPKNLSVIPLDKEYNFTILGAYYKRTNQARALRLFKDFLKDEFDI